jgi:hypothetical protein
VQELWLLFLLKLCFTSAELISRHYAQTMDPLTITTTFITLATFIKDLIDVGEGIRRSIEKV